MSSRSGEGEPHDLPDERVVRMRVDTVPPGLLVRAIGRVVGGLHELRDIDQEPQVGPSPQDVAGLAWGRGRQRPL